jgi:hypothetical protein
MNKTLIIYGCFIVFSSVVEGMPKPTTASSVGYQWAYSTLQALAGNIAAARAQPLPK